MGQKYFAAAFGVTASASAAAEWQWQQGLEELFTGSPHAHARSQKLLLEMSS
jgi:hypothetical protein